MRNPAMPAIAASPGSSLSPAARPPQPVPADSALDCGVCRSAGSVRHGVCDICGVRFDPGASFSRRSPDELLGASFGAPAERTV